VTLLDQGQEVDSDRAGPPLEDLGAEGTRTPDPLVANSVHGGRPGASEHGSGRSKAQKTCRSHSRCCTSLLYFSALRTERPGLLEPVTRILRVEPRPSVTFPRFARRLAESHKMALLSDQIRVRSAN
jgi:hypothetical protein